MYTKHCIKYLKLQRNLILTAICSQNIFQICIFIHLILYNLGNLHAFPHSVQFSSVTQLCPTLSDPMNRSTPGLPVHHQLPEFTQLMSIKSVMPSSHLILCRPLSSPLQSSPASRSSPMSHFFTSGDQSIGVSALASVLPMNTQD